MGETTVTALCTGGPLAGTKFTAPSPSQLIGDCKKNPDGSYDAWKGTYILKDGMWEWTDMTRFHTPAAQ